jgi:hypothetical protein
MTNPIVAHIFRKLGERVGTQTRAELIAELIVSAAMGGDMIACKLIIDAIEVHDPALNSYDDEDEA